MSWDDVRVFLGVVRAGTLRRGAASLGTSHSTTLRRITALEESLGTRLFHRRRDGYVLTAAGERAHSAALILEDRIQDMQRQVQGSDARLSGMVRVALPDAVLPTLLRALPRFEAAHPEIRLELVTSTRFVDLHQGDADVAIRIAQAPAPDLVGRRISDIVVGIYGSKKYARHAGKRDVFRLDWLGWERAANTMFGNWIDKHVEARHIRVRLGGMPDLSSAIDADLGVTLTPTIFGDLRGWHCFRRVKDIRAPLWVLSHSDLKATARVRVVRDFISDAFARTTV